MDDTPRCQFCGQEMKEGSAQPIELLGNEKVAAHVWTCENPKCSRDVRSQIPDHKVKRLADAKVHD